MAAVDVDERPVATGPSLMNGPGEESLAGAGLSEDQNRRLASAAGSTREELSDLRTDRRHQTALATQRRQRRGHTRAAYQASAWVNS